MKFNSQVCTTYLQSERLVKMGLKPETADMMSLLVSFSGKFYGKRSAERRKKNTMNA